MNVFELSAIASPAAGASAGALYAEAPGLIPTVTAVGLGLVIGFVTFLASIGITVLICRLSGLATATEKLSVIQWLASSSAVLGPIASPFLAWVVSAYAIAGLNL